MAGSSSLEAVRRKIRSLQEQADAAEERAGSLQRELDYERKLRETVRDAPSTQRPPPQYPTPPLAPSPPTPGGASSRAAGPLEPTDPFPHAPGRTLAEGAGSARASLSFHSTSLV